MSIIRSLVHSKEMWKTLICLTQWRGHQVPLALSTLMQKLVQAFNLGFVTYSRVVKDVRNYISLGTRDHPFCYLCKLQTSSTIYPLSRGFSELMKIFGSPAFQLKTSSSLEAYSELLRSFIKEAVCYL